jgi:manganese/zinc/iron transport system permease protein
MISYFAGSVDLDQECVLYGEIAYVPIDVWITPAGTVMGPRALYISGSILVLVLTFITVGYKELFLTTFDPSYAAALGISTTLWHYLLMGAVSLTTVASFETVGAILVVAFLIAPPATAYLLTDNFKHMLILTVIIGILTSIGGYLLGAWFDGSIAGGMAIIAGILFATAFIYTKMKYRQTVSGN